MRKFKIEVEGAFLEYIILISTVCDTEDGFNLLLFALTNLEKRDKIHIGYEKPDLPMKDCETYEIEETKEEYLEKAKNKVCGEYIYAYPPGSPIIAPGEIISDKFVCQIKKLYESGVNILSDSNLLPLKILTKK